MATQTTFNIIEAARAARVDKSTISKAIKAGKLSATRKENGGWEIDAAELFRVYPPSSDKEPSPPSSASAPELLVENRELHIKLEAAETRLKDAELRIRDKDDDIRDLRHRLDAEGEERRKITMMLLTYQQTVQPKETEKKHEDQPVQPASQPNTQQVATSITTPRMGSVWRWLRGKN